MTSFGIPPILFLASCFESKPLNMTALLKIRHRHNDTADPWILDVGVGDTIAILRSNLGLSGLKPGFNFFRKIDNEFFLIPKQTEGIVKVSGMEVLWTDGVALS